MSELLKMKSDFKDFSAVLELIPTRKKRMAAASATPITEDSVNDLARALHPDGLSLVIKQVRNEAGGARTFRLAPDAEAGTENLPLFRAGQYLSVKLDVDGTFISRPYSISSSPADAQKGFIEITVRKKDGGFATEYIWKKWKAGVKVETSGPCGFFYYEPLRDSKDIVALAGGCGVTPFRSMIKDIVENNLDVNFTLMYGVNKPDEVIFEKELVALAKKSKGKVTVYFVCCAPDSKWCGPTGFLTAATIKKLVGGDVSGKTSFICGPQAMYGFLDKEMKGFKLPRRLVRREVFGEAPDVTKLLGYPNKTAGIEYDMTVHIGGNLTIIPAKASESLVVALERGGVAPPSQCRSGECGYCRSLLLNGDIFVSPENDGRRAADKKFGWIHPCSTYPLSDLEIKVMREA